MIIDILIALMVQLSVAVGMPAAIAILVVSAGVAVFLCHFVATWLANALVGEGTNSGPSMSEQERPWRPGSQRFSKMEDKELEDFLQRSPRNPQAVWEQGKRLKAAGDLSAHARRLEYFLTLDSKIDIEQRCMIHHQLADLYMGPLQDPERSRQALEAFVSKYPDTKQAIIMRERLKRLSSVAT